MLRTQMIAIGNVANHGQCRLHIDVELHACFCGASYGYLRLLDFKQTGMLQVMAAQSSFTFFVYYHGFNTLLSRLFNMYFCFRAIMERNLAMRRCLQLPRLVIPPIGRWRHLVKCLKPTVAIPELEISSSERKRTCEEIFQPYTNYDAYAAECAFCVLHGVWPRCGVQQPKRQRQSPMLAGNSD